MGLLVQLSDVKTYLQIGFTTDDALLTQIMTNVSAAIESYCKHSFSSVLAYTDILDGGYPELSLLNRPLVAVSALLDLSQRQANEIVGTGNGAQTSFTHTMASVPLQPGTVQIAAGAIAATDDGNGNLTGTAVAAGSTVNYSSGAMTINFSAAVASGTQVLAGYTPMLALISPMLYTLDLPRAIVFPLTQPPAGQPIPAGLFEILGNRTHWGFGRRRWQANYTAGYASVPADVQLAALIMVAGRYNRRDALAEEAVGDYRYRTQSGPDSGFSEEVEQLLSPWREVVI